MGIFFDYIFWILLAYCARSSMCCAKRIFCPSTVDPLRRLPDAPPLPSCLPAAQPLSLSLFCFLTPPLQYLFVGIEALQDLKLVEFTSGKPSSGQYDCQLPQQRAVL